jgi:hypothetical protein
MNLDEIREIIRSSIWRQIHEIASKANACPRSFSDFRWCIAKALTEAHAPQNLILESYESEQGIDDSFDVMYEAWMGIQSEMKNVRNSDADKTWNEIKDFYIRGVVEELLNRR